MLLRRKKRLENKHIFTKKEAYIMSFLISVILCVIASMVKLTFPIDKRIIVDRDMYYQYIPFMHEFLHKIKNGESLAYTWSIGLGTNFFSIIVYYLTSPLNIFMLLVPENYIVEAMDILIIVKISFASLAMTYYLDKHYDAKEYKLLPVFSIIYAFSGYICAYYWNIMWLDSIAIFPVLLISLERLIKGKSLYMYVLCLTYCIIANYYISIMICIFLCIYFVAFTYINYMNKKSFFIAFRKFILLSLLAGGIAAFLLIPEAYSLLNGAASDEKMPIYFKECFNFVEIIERHLAFLDSGLNGANLSTQKFPYIYTGTITFILLPMYFINKDIDIREKKINIIMIIIFYLSFSINIFMCLWHGMRYPHDLWNREAFIYNFLIISICFKSCISIKSVAKDKIYRYCFFAIGLIIFLHVINGKYDYPSWVYYANILFVGIWSFILYKFVESKRKSKIIFIMLLFMNLELLMNFCIGSWKSIEKDKYFESRESVEEFIAETADQNTEFQRYVNKSYSVNQGALYHYNSADIFSSIANKNAIYALGKWGCESNAVTYNINGSTPLLRMLLGIDYIMLKDGGIDISSENHLYMDKKGGMKLYKNVYKLSQGFLMDEKLEDIYNKKYNNGLELQNAISNAYTGKNMFKKVKHLEGENYVEYIFTEPGYYYISNVNPELVSKFKILHNDRMSEIKNIKFIEIAHFDKGDRLEFITDDYYYKGNRETEILKNMGRIKGNKRLEENYLKQIKHIDFDINIYKTDFSVVEKLYSILSKNQMENITYGDTWMKGDINCTRAGKLFISIPYEEAWDIYIDGKKVEKFKSLDAFLSCNLDKGYHKVELRYHIIGIKLAALISIISLGILILSYCIRKNINRR